MIFLIHFLFSFLGTVAFGVLTNIPRRALLPSGITGGFGWICYYYLIHHGSSLAFSNFSAVFLMGCIGIYFSKRYKMPLITFNIPSIVALVPGAPAYKAAREFAIGDNLAGFENLMIVVITAGSIAAGFIMVSLVEQIFKKGKLKQQQRRSRHH